MRGLLRVFVVGFTVVSLMLVAAVGVSATSGKSGSSNTVKNSVVAVLSGHPDQAVANNGTTVANSGNGSGSSNTLTNSVVALLSGHPSDNNSNGNNGNDNNGNHNRGCKSQREHHEHATKGHKNEPCGEDDSG